ncbi:MAG: HAD-IA family hydrolase [Acidobacteria bacterium]|nr:HAD-IA family hydrolase [Acidobacteriota bacterium]
MPIRAIVFDLDGTLVDSLTDIGSAVDHALSGLSLPPRSLGWVRRHVGQGAAHLMRCAVGPGAPPELTEAALDRFVRFYDAHPCEATVPYPGAADLLAALAGQGRQLAVLSNKPGGITVKVLKTLGLDGHFRRIWGGDSFHGKKPAPDGLLHFMAETGSGPSETVLVGDSAADVNCAHAAGAWSCFHSRGYGTLENAVRPPHRTFDDIRELPGILVDLDGRALPADGAAVHLPGTAASGAHPAVP